MRLFLSLLHFKFIPFSVKLHQIFRPIPRRSYPHQGLVPYRIRILKHVTPLISNFSLLKISKEVISPSKRYIFSFTVCSERTNDARRKNGRTVYFSNGAHRTVKCLQDNKIQKIKLISISLEGILTKETYLYMNCI